MQNRREFLKASAAFGAFNIIPAKVLWGAEAPSNQITRAILGFGEIAHCQYHLRYKGSRLIALCDIDRRHIEDGLWCAEKEGYGRVRTARDFREILAMPDVDVVHISTPPHWHGVMSVMAARAGKDVWDEKPMTRTVYEALRVRDVIRETKRMFRINTNYRVTDQPFYSFGFPISQVKKICQSGMLGGPLTVVVGTAQGFSQKYGWSGLLNMVPERVPEGFDYDMWLGPAPYKPYHPYRTHSTFRGFWDYDAGSLGDMAQHYLDPVQYALGKDDETPIRIDYKGPLQHPEVVGRYDRITLTYRDGTKIILDGDDSLKDEPYFRGPKGAIYPAPKGAKAFRLTDASGRDLDTAKVLAELPPPPPMITDFMESVRTRKPFGLDVEKSFRSLLLVQLPAVAMRLGRGFDFDPETFTAIGDEAANRFIRQPMRDPWAKEMYGTPSAPAPERKPDPAVSEKETHTLVTANLIDSGYAQTKYPSPIASVWQDENRASIDRMTSESHLNKFLANEWRADALCACVTEGYSGDAMKLTQIQSISLLVMKRGYEEKRKLWVAALKRAQAKARTNDVDTFFRQQLDVCDYRAAV